MPPRLDRGQTFDKTLPAILGIRLGQLAANYPDQWEFLKAIGISQGTYYAILKGDSNPTLDTLELIAKGLGISVWELIGLNDGVVKDALSTHEIDLEAITSASRARAKAIAKIKAQQRSAGLKKARG